MILQIAEFRLFHKEFYNTLCNNLCKLSYLQFSEMKCFQFSQQLFDFEPIYYLLSHANQQTRDANHMISITII